MNELGRLNLARRIIVAVSVPIVLPALAWFFWMPFVSDNVDSSLTRPGYGFVFLTVIAVSTAFEWLWWGASSKTPTSSSSC